MGFALIGAGIIAVSPVRPPHPAADVPDIQLTAGEVDMVLDLVRHGQSTDNVAGIIGTVAPGAGLSDLGKQQAITVGEELYNGGNNVIDGVYASEFLRTQQTAWPLVELMAGNSDYNNIPDGPTPLSDLDPSHILAGLNEVNAGFLNGATESDLTGLLYVAAPMAWIFGMDWVPQLGSTTDPNGIVFDEQYSGAVDTIYNAGGATSGGELHDVAFSHEMAITTWTMMNVKNPDFAILFDGLAHAGFLANTGQVVVEGNPTDGWTLVSWDGQAVPQDPGLLTELFVDYRNLITAPQMAAYNIGEALLTRDPAEIMNALQIGADQVGTALWQFPVAVAADLLGTCEDIGAGLAGSTPADIGLILGEAILGSL